MQACTATCMPLLPPPSCRAMDKLAKKTLWGLLGELYPSVGGDKTWSSIAMVPSNSLWESKHLKDTKLRKLDKLPGTNVVAAAYKVGGVSSRRNARTCLRLEDKLVLPRHVEAPRASIAVRFMLNACACPPTAGCVPGGASPHLLRVPPPGLLCHRRTNAKDAFQLRRMPTCAACHMWTGAGVNTIFVPSDARMSIWEKPADVYVWDLAVCLIAAAGKACPPRLRALLPSFLSAFTGAHWAPCTCTAWSTWSRPRSASTAAWRGWSS
jgi:hypothetical protein